MGLYNEVLALQFLNIFRISDKYQLDFEEQFYMDIQHSNRKHKASMFCRIRNTIPKIAYIFHRLVIMSHLHRKQVTQYVLVYLVTSVIPP